MPLLYPLRFRPVLRRYLWGGRRLETALGKLLPPGDDWAESWEIVDRGSDQSVVEFGPLAGTTLGQLVGRYGQELVGRHHPQGEKGDRPRLPERPGGCFAQTGPVPVFPRPRFPLLLKFLDAARPLSVQVHPDDARAARLDPPEVGKTEAWVVIEAEPGSVIYAGLQSGIDRETLAAAIRQGRCQDCLHVLHPSPGDCIFLPAGTVHALGAGLLVAEIQQPSDVTYRLFDWNRLGPDGQPRALHVEQALDAIDFRRGPIQPQQPRPTGRPEVSRLVECKKFVLDRWEFDRPIAAGGDDRCHVISVLQGSVQVEGDPPKSPLPRGERPCCPRRWGRCNSVRGPGRCCWTPICRSRGLTAPGMCVSSGISLRGLLAPGYCSRRRVPLAAASPVA